MRIILSTYKLIKPMNTIFKPQHHITFTSSTNHFKTIKLFVRLDLQKTLTKESKDYKLEAKKLSVFKTFLVAYNRLDAYNIEQKIQRMFKHLRKRGRMVRF